MRTLIKNGTLVDPANRICSKLNLLIEDGAVEDVTRQEPSADQIIDAEGKYVAPGFIDIHMHEDSQDGTGRLEHTIGEALLRMGVTTAFGGNCGINVMEPKDYLELVDRDGSPVNMGLFVGHTLMRELAGHKDKYTGISREEQTRMETLVQENLEAGCFGVSFGIRYVPGICREEMLAAAKLCRGKDKLVTAHVRDDGPYVFQAVEELIHIGRELGLPVQNSHVGSMGGFGQMERLLAMMDAYRAQGTEVTGDCYPYYAFSTRIGQTTYDEGFLERYETDYSVIEICEGKYKGQRCNSEMFRELRKEAPETLTVCHVMKKEDVDMALIHPSIMLASDGILHKGQGHPRAAGSFPRFLCNYVKTGKIELYEAVEKMTSMQAVKLGLSRKGRLNRGADGDVVVFDLNRIKDNATFENPLSAPDGMDHVLIAGAAAVRDGQVVSRNLGRALRKL